MFKCLNVELLPDWSLVQRMIFPQTLRCSLPAWFQVGLLKGLAYVVVQSVGGVVGAAILSAVVPDEVCWHNDSNKDDDDDNNGNDEDDDNNEDHADDNKNAKVAKDDLSRNDPKPSTEAQRSLAKLMIMIKIMTVTRMIYMK